MGKHRSKIMRKASKIVAVMFSVVLCMSMVPSVSYAAAKEPAVTVVVSEGVDADEVVHTERMEHDSTVGNVSRIGEVHCKHTHPLADQTSTMREHVRTVYNFTDPITEDFYAIVDWYRCVVCGYERYWERV